MATSPDDVRRAIEAARASGNEDDASALEQYLSQLESATGEGLSGPALNPQQRQNRIAQYEQEYRDITVPKDDARSGFMGTTVNEMLSEISGEPEDVFEDREVAQPPIDPSGRVGQSLTQIEVGTKGMAQRYFQRKDDAIDARKAIWEVVYSQLPETEKERLSGKPKHWGWEYDDFRNMPFLDFVQYVEKGGMVTRDDIKGILGEEQYMQLLKGDHPTQEGAGMFYEYFVQPALTSKEGLKPSAQLALSMEKAQKNWLTDETRESLAKPWTAQDATWYKPWSWFDETTKAPWEDFDGFYYSVMENVPNLAAAYVGARGGGRGAASLAKVKRFDSIEDAAKAQQKLAGLGGAAGGGATEALLIRDATYQETAQRIRDLPQETWDQYPVYQDMIENGITPEHAKQIIAFEVAKKAGDVAAVTSGILLGSPMGWWFGQRAAGKIAKEGMFKAMAKGQMGEFVQEGAQGMTEQLVSNVNLQRIDPNQDPTEGLLEAGVGEAMSTLGPGALMGAASTGGEKPAGLTRADQKAATAVKTIKDAINERYKFEQELTAAEDDISQMPTQERIENYRKFEELQEAEAQAILDNAKTLKAYMEKNPSAVDRKMLNRLEMKANATLSSIEAARSKRTTLAKQLIEEQDLYREREAIEQKVKSNVMKLEDIERQLEAIRAVQEQREIDSNMYDELRREGYGGWAGPNEDRFIIKPKGKRAAKELARQARDLRNRIEAGYTGGERRKNDRRREAIEMMTPQQREKVLHTDSLTGVKTRRAFNERVQNIDERDPDKRGESKARVVAAVDVDSLKWVNDNMGLASGDRLLMAVADELNQEGVDVYRLGGDEFAVTGYSPQQVETVLQRAAQNLTNKEIGDEEQSVTPQITWALGSDWEEASNAEQRMKKDRVAKGKVAARKQRPNTYKAKKQLPLFQMGKPENPYDVDTDNVYTVRDKKSNQAATFSFLPISRDRVLIEREEPKYLGQQAENTLKTSIDVTEWARQEIPEKTIVELAVNQEYDWNAKFERKHPRKTRLDEDFFEQVRFQGGNRPWTMGGKEGDLYIRRHGKAAGDVSTERVSENDIAIKFDNDVLLTDYMKYTFQYLKPQFQARLRGTAQQFITQDDINDVLTKHFARMANRRFEDEYLPNRYYEISDIVGRGDVVEILTPEGAIFGTITEIKGGKRARWFVTADGRDYVFNPQRNWLIVRPETDPADVEYLVGKDYVQDGPTIKDVQIGHVGNELGDWYADLGDDFAPSDFPDPYDNWWDNDYPEWNKFVPFVPEIGTATKEEMRVAAQIISDATINFDNLPPINAVGSIEELESVAPETVAEARSQGYSLRGIKGWFDETRPDVGIVIIVPNITGKPGTYTFEMNLKETLMHEMIGHYGIRGLFGNDIELRHEMLKIYHAPEFSKVRDSIRAKVKRPAGMNETEYRQLVGEEMIAYITGEVLSGKLDPTPKQKSLLQRFFDWVRSWFKKKGYTRSYSTLDDAKKEFFNDRRVMELIARSSDYVRNGKNFEYTYRDGRHVKFIRDGEIFRMGITSAVDHAMQPLSKNQRKQLASKYGGIENVPKEVPLFPDEGSPAQYEQIIAKLKKDGKVKAKELELTYLDPSEEWYFLRDATYGTLWEFARQSKYDLTWYKGIVPKQIEDQLDELMDFSFVGPRERQQSWDSYQRDHQAIADIMNTTIDQKQTRITKDILLRFLESQKVVRIYAQPKGGHHANYEDVARFLFPEQDPGTLNDDQAQIVGAEVELINKFGWNVGYDEQQQRWFQRSIYNTDYSELMPHGIDVDPQSYEIVYLKQEGGGLEVGHHSHFGSEAGVLAHLRIGKATIVGVDLPAENPDWNNKAVALGELQSDWLTNARKSFSDHSERQRAETERGQLANALGLTTRDMIKVMSTHILDELKTKMKPLANLPQGSLQSELEARIRNRYGEYATDGQREAMYRELRNEEVNKVINEIRTSRDLVESFANIGVSLTDIPGTFDARMYDRLDDYAVRQLATKLYEGLNTIIQYTDLVKNAPDQKATVEAINNIMELDNFSSALSWARRSTSQRPQVRIPYAKSKMNELLARVYDGLNIPLSKREEVLGVGNERSRSIFSINRSIIDKINSSMGLDARSRTGGEMIKQIFDNNNLIENGISTDELSLDFRASADNNSYEVIAYGSDQGLNKFREAIGLMLKKHVSKYGPINWREMNSSAIMRKNRYSRLAGNNVDFNDPDWETIKQAWDFEDHEDAIGSDGYNDQFIRDYDVTTMEAFEEDGDRMWNYLDEIIDEAFNEMDWEGVYNDDGEGLWPGSEDYQGRVTFDDDGDAYTDDARQWLEEARDEYRRNTMQEDEAYREQAYERVRDEFYEDPPMLWTAMMPTAWNRDGTVNDSVQIAIVQPEPGGYARIYIANEDVAADYSTKNAAFEAVPDAIKEWYENEGITPPVGELFGPEEVVTGTDEAAVSYTDVIPDVDETMPPFVTMGQHAAASVAEAKDKPITVSKMFERMVELDKALESGIVGVPQSPVGNDKYWRTTALKYLISDAVRKGAPGIVWHGGTASTIRGGRYVGQEALKYLDKIRWTLETMEIGDKEQEVYVIRGEDMADMVVSKQYAIGALGSDVAAYIERQRSGELPLIPERKTATGRSVTPSMDDYLVSQTGHLHFVYLRRDHSFIGYTQNQDEVEGIIQDHMADVEGGADVLAPGVDVDLPEGPGAGGIRKMSGVITSDDLGGPIQLITGRNVNDYRTWMSVPLLAGARESYERITPTIWEKELKKYGAKIEKIPIRITNPEAARKQGGRKVNITGERDRRIAETHGDVAIREVTGETHGYVVMSEMEGPLNPMLFQSLDLAEQWLNEWKEDNYGSEDGAIEVNFIRINDKMRDEFSGPVPPFHYDPSQDPDLKSADKKIGFEKTKLREHLAKIRSMARSEFQQGAFDKMYGIKNALTQTQGDIGPYVSARLTTSLDSQMKAVLEYGHPVWREGIMQTEGRGLLEILKPVADRIDLWGRYMVGRRAQRLKDEGRENLFDDAEIKAMVRLGEKYPIFEQVADEYADFNKKVLDFAEASGIIDKDTRPVWENADYIPFYRVQDDRIMGPLSKSAGIAGQAKPIRRLRGGEANIGDPIHNIMVNLTKLLDSSMKNNASLEVIDELMGTGMIAKVGYDMSAELIPMAQVKKILIDKGMDPATIPADAMKGLQKMFAITPPEGTGIIPVLRNGKREYYQTDDVMLWRAMLNVNRQQFGQWMRLFRAPKRFLTTMITLDPGFMVANFVRDSMSAFVLSRDQFIPVASAVKGFGKALAKDEDMRTMLSSGAAFESGYINQYDPQSTQRLIKKHMKDKTFARTVLNSPLKLFEAWKAIGSATENANRMAVYQAAIRAGKSKKQAVYEAKDLMDFSMGGDWPVIQFLIQTVPFMGARMQGLHRLGRGAVEHPVAFTFKGLLLSMAGMALWFAFREDERYKALEEWDKDTYFHFWIGDNHYRLPKGFEVGAIFNTIPERIFEYMYSQENDAGKLLLRRWGFMLAETFNMNPIPQVVAPAVEMQFNHNFFTGRYIVSPYEKERLPPEQYRTTTSPTLVEIARALPSPLDTASTKIRSPLQLQNLYHGYTGTLGNYVLMGADWLTRRYMDYPLPPTMDISRYPLYGRFVRGDAPRPTKYQEEFYRLMDKTNMVQGSLSFLERTEQGQRLDKIIEEYEPYVRVADSLESIRQDVSDINRAQQQIYMDMDMSPDQKKKEIDMLEMQKQELFQEGYKLRPGGEENPDRPVTQEDVIGLIERWGVDDSIAYQRSLEENAPSTQELLEMIEENMEKRQLESLAKIARN